MSDCGCVYSDHQCSDVWDVTKVKARKEHQCSECGGQIHKGERYERIGNLYDGHWSTLRLCSVCRSIADVFFCGGYGAFRLIEDLRNHLEDRNGQISSDCIISLTPDARAFVCDMIDVVWREINEMEEDDD